jgi:hypothetical protein
MLNHQTLDQLRALHLDGMVAALQDQATTGVASDLAFEDRLALLVQLITMLKVQLLLLVNNCI